MKKTLKINKWHWKKWKRNEWENEETWMENMIRGKWKWKYLNEMTEMKGNEREMNYEECNENLRITEERNDKEMSEKMKHDWKMIRNKWKWKWKWKYLKEMMKNIMKT